MRNTRPIVLYSRLLLKTYHVHITSAELSKHLLSKHASRHANVFIAIQQHSNLKFSHNDSY